MKDITLRAGRERRLLSGHRWVFSNEIAESLSAYEPGEWVRVRAHKGHPLGAGYINPHSLIAVRLMGSADSQPGEEMLRDRLLAARRQRRLWYPRSQVVRWVYSEADDLPGLVVDRYGDVLCYQINTLGMSRLEPMIQELLVDLFEPRAVVCRNDSSVRRLEGLPLEKGVVYGELTEPVVVEIHGLKVVVDPLEGQKTGIFLDQRENREVLKRFAAGRRVLDLFCYDALWSLVALREGAQEAVAVDQSASALQRAQTNAAANGLANKCNFFNADVFQFLKQTERQEFDIVVCDPPAFAKNRRSLPDALKGYTDVNRRAMLALKRGGTLITCSCSYLLDEAAFEQVLLRAARASGRTLRLLERRGQAYDHPVLLAMPETRYLKCWVLEVA